MSDKFSAQRRCIFSVLNKNRSSSNVNKLASHVSVSTRNIKRVKRRVKFYRLNAWIPMVRKNFNFSMVAIDKRRATILLVAVPSLRETHSTVLVCREPIASGSRVLVGQCSVCVRRRSGANGGGCLMGVTAETAETRGPRPPMLSRALPTRKFGPRRRRFDNDDDDGRRRTRSPPVAHATTMVPNARRGYDRMGHTAAKMFPPPMLVLLLLMVTTFVRAEHYTNQFAVRVSGGDRDGQADRVARKHGFINRGQVSVGLE